MIIDDICPECGQSMMVDCPHCHGSGKSTSRTTQCPRCHSHVSLMNNFCGNCGFDVRGIYDDCIYCGGTRRVRDDTHHLKHTRLFERTKPFGTRDSPFPVRDPIDSGLVRANWQIPSAGVSWQGPTRGPGPLTPRVEGISSNDSGGVSIWWVVFVAILIIGICGACWWLSSPS
jgi:hypothetical protein